MSACRQNYHQDCEDGVNAQINLELYAMYVYQSLATYFERHDVALPNIAATFRKASKEELGHAELLMRFQNDRGGKVVLSDIKAPANTEWGSALKAMEAASDLEKTVNQALLDLHKISDKHNDSQMSDFIENNFLTEQVEAIKELGDHITNLKRVGPGHGEYHFDKELK
uniref:Ferritin n=1 Tax=Suberites domuncula TaxID=55567 RepID=Q8T311_SUBDO|nr:Ferritin type 1 [Suberites domuncula]